MVSGTEIEPVPIRQLRFAQLLRARLFVPGILSWSVSAASEPRAKSRAHSRGSQDSQLGARDRNRTGTSLSGPGIL